MNLNATFWGQALFILALVVIFFTIKFAKGKANSEDSKVAEPIKKAFLFMVIPFNVSCCLKLRP